MCRARRGNPTPINTSFSIREYLLLFVGLPQPLWGFAMTAKYYYVSLSVRAGFFFCHNLVPPLICCSKGCEKMERNSVDEILTKLPDGIRIPLSKARNAYENQATEIVMRADRPVCIYVGKNRLYITFKGYLTDNLSADGIVYSTQKDIEKILMCLCDYSLYAYQDELNSGFITIGGGVRVGLCGRAVIKNGIVTNLRDISTLSFRIARDIRCCADELLDKIKPLSSVLICGEPGSGKTTLIRDMARQLSYKCRVSLLDERGELTAYSRGHSGFDIGLCDVYAGYPKGTAAVQATRSMNPDIIVCDELGDRTDADMLTYSLRCGIAFIASVHAASMDDLRSRKVTADVIATGAFRYFVFLSGKGQPGSIAKIYEMSGHA